MPLCLEQQASFFVKYISTDNHHAPAAAILLYVSISLGEWESFTLMGTKRSWPAAAVLNGVMYAIGGRRDTGDGGDLSSVEIYDATNETWAPLDQMGTRRSICARAVMNGTIYTVGGRDSGKALSSAEKYDAGIDTWSRGFVP